MIKVSVIIPVYNVEKYIDKCLNSIVNQTMKDIEIIIVNDGSPDNSEKIILKYQKKYPKIIKYIKQENGGQGSARNRGLDIAKGEFIDFVDPDDWIEEDMLEKMYNLAIKEKSDLVTCDMVEHYQNKIVYQDCTNYKTPYEKTPNVCNRLFRKKIVEKIRFLEDKIWYEDLSFTTEILLSNPKISNISEGLYHSLNREGSTMNNNNSLKNLDIIIILEDIKKYAMEKKVFNKELFSYLVFNHILITSINRVSNQRNKEQKRVIKTMRKYCKDNLGDYKKYKYYKGLSKNRKIIANLNYYGLHKISKLLLNTKAKLKDNNRNK